MEKVLYDYLLKDKTDLYKIELLQYEINKRVYYEGSNFIKPFDPKKTLFSISEELFGLFYQLVNLRKISPKANKSVISTAYFSFNDELKKIGYQPFTPPWKLSRKAPYIKDLAFLVKSFAINDKLKYADFNGIINNNFFSIIDSYYEYSLNMIKNSSISALVFSHDLGFFERIFIDIFKKLNRPTFIYDHGAPPVNPNSVDNNRADYLIVWGEAVKDKYVSFGIDRNKILVSGHPKYVNVQGDSPILEFNFENILVLSRAKCGIPSDSTKVTLSDRGMGIVYLLQIQAVLLDLGVKKVRLRVHPSENPNWYMKFLDDSFFIVDTEDLKSSLSKSTLVIGGTSTVFIESIYCRKNYVIYEPTDDGLDIYNIVIGAPFDGTDKKAPVAKNKAQLKSILLNKELCNYEIVNSYFKSPFDISFIKQIIN